MNNLSHLRTNVAAYGGLAALALAVYAPGLQTPYYGDDFLLYFSEETGVLDPFYSKSPNGFYRPATDAFAVATQALFGMNPLPVHLTILLLHVALSWLVFAVTTRLGFSRWQAGLAATFMVISQANAHAVLSNDTLGQVGSALWGYLGLWLLYAALERLRLGEVGGTWTYRWVGSVLCFGVALLFKEVGVSFFVMMCALLGTYVLAQGQGEGRRVQRVKQAIIILAPYVMVLGAYLWARSAFAERPPALGPERYNFRFGLNVIENAALFASAAVTAISSATVYRLVSDGAVAGALAALAVSGFFWGSAAFGCYRSRRDVLGWIAVLAILSLIPTYFLNHVSELYLYNAMPLLSILFGVGLGEVWELAKPYRARFIGVVALTAAFAASHVWAVEQKAALMAANGRRASTLLDQVIPYAERLPSGGKLVLLNAEDDEPAYSVFLMHGFGVLWRAERLIKARSGRSDIRVEIAELGVPAPEVMQPRSIALRLCGDGTEVCPLDVE